MGEVRLNRNEMKAFIDLAAKADTTNIKSLTQEERKILKVMSEALREGKSEITISDIHTLASIKLALKSGILLETTSYSEKMKKVWDNLFNGRVSSNSLKQEIATTSQLLKKSEQIKGDLKAKRDELSQLVSGPDRDKYTMADIKTLSREIAALSMKETKLNKEKQDSLAELKKAIPNVIREASTKDRQMEDVFEETLQDNFTKGVDSKQSNKDFARPGTQLSLTDSTRGEFTGTAYGVKGTANKDRVESQNEAFNQLFEEPHEKEWKNVVKESMVQAPFIHLVRNIHTDLENFQNKSFRVLHDSFQGALSTKNLSADVKRDKQGEITHVNCKVRLVAPVHAESKVPGDKSIDQIGFVESTMTFTLELKEGKPVVSNIKSNHVFTENEPKPDRAKTKTPGFVSFKPKAPVEKDHHKNNIRQYESDLSKIKMDLLSNTKEKIAELDAKIFYLRKDVNPSTGTNEQTLREYKKVLDEYEKYRDALKSNQ